MKALYLLPLALLALLSSCEEETAAVDVTESVTFYSSINSLSPLSSCFIGGGLREGETRVFRNDAAYRAYGETRRFTQRPECDTVALFPIDFGRYSLIGVRTVGGGCTVSYDRRVTFDHERRRVVYEIDADYEGGCHMLILSNNWAVVPKIPADYEVIFRVK